MSEMTFRLVYEMTKLNEAFCRPMSCVLPTGTLVTPFVHMEWEFGEGLPITSVEYVVGQHPVTMYAIDDFGNPGVGRRLNEFRQLMSDAGWTRY